MEDRESNNAVVTLSVRCPIELKERIEQAAAEDRRTLSNFIVVTLEANLLAREREAAATASRS